MLPKKLDAFHAVLRVSDSIVFRDAVYKRLNGLTTLDRQKYADCAAPLSSETALQPYASTRFLRKEESSHPVAPLDAIPL
jgi:hypothetical protein